MSSENVEISKIEYRSIIKSLSLKGLTGKEVYDEISKTVGEICPSYATVKNWVASFKREKVSVEDGNRPRRPISEFIPEMLTHWTI